MAGFVGRPRAGGAGTRSARGAGTAAPQGGADAAARPAGAATARAGVPSGPPEAPWGVTAAYRGSYRGLGDCGRWAPLCRGYGACGAGRGRVGATAWGGGKGVGAAAWGGGARPVASATAVAGAAAEAPKTKPKRPRLPALDALRFFLISYICIGHFVAMATKDVFFLRLFSQVNVAVGAFFVISGYVMAYTATELGKLEASPRVFPAAAYTVSRIAGFFPVYFAAQLLFAPVFIYADVFYNGWVKTAWHALATTSLSQAWFPMHAELWNPPTWFLSALAWALVAVPYMLPYIAEMSNRGLRRCLATLTAVSVLSKVAYSYDLGCWALFEGMTRAHPNLALFNSLRFSPFFALVEILMGVVAARLVMVGDSGRDPEESTLEARITRWASSVPPLAIALCMESLFFARAAGLVQVNDMLIRGCVFIPLFTWFLMRIHRVTIDPEAPKFSLVKLLEWGPLQYLGKISFCIYIVHGPIGQIFYKRVIANKIFGFVWSKYPPFFYVYLALVLVTAAAMQYWVAENRWVAQRTKAAVTRINGWLLPSNLAS